MRFLAFLFLLAVCVFSTAQNVAARQADENRLPSPNIVISQIYGNGGRTVNSVNAPYRNDFVELFNRGSVPVSLNGWSIQYASAGGANWVYNTLPDATIQPGQYFLIQFASDGNVGAPLPTPDFVAPPTNQGFILNLSGTSGKIALVSSTAQLPASSCPTSSSIIDLLGYGAAATCFETARTADLGISTGAVRNGNGCTDTDNNAADFTITAPTPRNSSSPTNNCNLGSTLTASGAASPSTVNPGATTLLTVRVFPAASPTSTGITVVADLTSIGGSPNQQFFDDGTNGDATPGDNVFSFQAQIPVNQAGGNRNLPVTVADAQSRTANTTINLVVSAPAPNDDPLLLGNPSNATADVNNPFNYLMVKPQYSLSYHRDNGGANWVAWRLDASWLGTAERQDNFRPDETLPAGWYRVTTEDYSNSGFDRGHMTPSGDRTRSVEDNSATFLMTNILPQTAQNNQQAWERLETYSRELANAGNELYIFSGGAGTRGRIGNNRVNVPLVTWKVILVLPSGDNDIQRINKNTRTIAVIMPNDNTVTFDWRQYRTSVDAVERLTGYDFFSNVPRQVQFIMERRVDTQ